jgi:phospholipid/cholesterol/gamma-HCH transport system permease protein
MTTTVEYPQPAGNAVIRLGGEIDLSAARDFYRRVEALTRAEGISTIAIDFSEAGDLDTAGIAVLSLARQLCARRGRALHVTGLRDEHRAALGMMVGPGPPPPPTPRASPLEQLGSRGLGWWDSLRALARLVADVARTSALLLARRRSLPRGATTEQAVLLGVSALPIIGLLTFLVGIILAFQSAYQLREFGATVYVADLVGVAMVREFGPLIAAIILAGRSGAAVAAELGTMKVNEELDALETMGIDPTRYLLIPRLAALTLVQPALTLLAIFFGMAGGLLICMQMLNMSAALFFQRVVLVVELSDFWITLLKGVVFAWIISLSAIHAGIRVRGGASGVGRATTRSVVTSIFLIIVADSIFAAVTTVVQY